MKKVRIGVLGAYRGSALINYCKRANNVEIVAICDKAPDMLEAHRKNAEGLNITFYDNFKDFILHDMDAVVLANYANEHAPFAIEAMKRGLHVFSEVLPCQTMKEAVELVETVEETGMVYAYGENYCYLPATYEMTKQYKQGKIGEFEYGECEYIHNLEPVWHCLTYGEEDHWRNNWFSTFYCTHSLGPIIHMTGLRPVSVVGFEGTQNARKLRVGAKSGLFGIEMITLENGAIIKSIHGDLYKNSIWYSAYGSKGRMECGREDAKDGHLHKLYVNADEFAGDYGNGKLEVITPADDADADATNYGHYGSDFYAMYNFVERILGNKDADIIDVYEAMDMYLPGMFAYRSILKGNVSVEVPNLRDKNVRDRWRNDTACTDPKVAGDMLLPTFSKGTPVIDPAIYDHMKDMWQKELEKEESGYRDIVFSQSSEEQEEETI